jgi:glycosyltransferase involved in cell wall biosynthesis
MTGLSDEFAFAVFATGGIESDSVAGRLARICGESDIPVYTGSTVPAKYGGLAISATRLSRALWDFRPQIVHLHTEIPEATYVLAAGCYRRFRDLSIVRTIHNSVYWTPWRWLGKWSERRITSSYVACVSQGALDAFLALRKEAALDSPRCPAEVVFNGVRMNDAAPRRGEEAVQGLIRVMYAGRFEYQKGVDLIRDALVHAPLPAGTRGQLVLYGKGRMSREVKYLQLHPPDGWSIDVHDPVPSLEPVFPFFDLLMMPSRFEGLPLVAAEALAAGLPVIGTDAPGLREVFPAGYPWIAPAGDAARFGAALRHAIIHPEQRRSVGTGVAPFIRERFSMARMLSAYRACYRHVLPFPAPSSTGGSTSILGQTQTSASPHTDRASAK